MSQAEQSPEISKEEFVEWRKSLVTRFIIGELIQQVNDRVLLVRSHVRGGEFNKASYDEGFIAGLNTILDIDYEDTL